MLRGLLSELETAVGHGLAENGDGLFTRTGLRLALVTILLSSLLRATPSVDAARHGRQRTFGGLRYGLLDEKKLANIPSSENLKAYDVSEYQIRRSSHSTPATPFTTNVRRNMDPKDQYRARPGLHRRVNDDFQAPGMKSASFYPGQSGSTNLQDMLLNDPWFDDAAGYQDPNPTINVNDYAFLLALRIDEDDDNGEVLPFPSY